MSQPFLSLLYGATIEHAGERRAWAMGDTTRIVLDADPGDLHVYITFETTQESMDALLWGGDTFQDDLILHMGDLAAPVEEITGLGQEERWDGYVLHAICPNWGAHLTPPQPAPAPKRVPKHAYKPWTEQATPGTLAGYKE